jgi:hypothetical protein
MVKQSEFVAFIAALAPEGETALVVKQKPIARSGVALRHADGTPRYTWPAVLPNTKLRAQEALYLNTGSFVVDRFRDGKPSAALAGCDYVLCMMLDDIGTKSKAPPLAPTWRIETSEGNEQWGYVFAEQPHKNDYVPAMRAIASAGYTDPGAINATRNFRIPGSVNLKEGRNNFAARLVAFDPELAYTLEQICEALGVEPGEADADQDIPRVEVTDPDAEPVYAWLGARGLLMSHPNAEGWCSVICPNSEAHTDGQLEARYNPSARAFCCYHGHCDALDSAAFLAWVSANDGPTASPGIRDDLLARTFETVADAMRDEGPSPQVQAMLERVEFQEIARVDKTDWHKRFAYIVADDSYFDLETRREYTRANFNALYRHVLCNSVHPSKGGPRRIEASIAFDELRVAHRAKDLAAVIYAPGDAPIVERNGKLYGNKWRDGRPLVAATPAADVAPWLAHCRLLVPDARELDHCLDVMAFKLQHPRVKINHAILHGGDEGIGKDTMWAPFVWALCGPYGLNRAVADNAMLGQQWGYMFESELLILNELKQDEASDRRAIANKLKPIIAAPPDTISINRKGMHPYEALNRVQVIAFSNFAVPIVLPTQDRRWFCLWSYAPRMDDQDAVRLWKWFENGGYENVSGWLRARDVSKFMPHAPPFVTDAKLNLIAQGLSPVESYLVDLIETKGGPFASGVACPPFNDIMPILYAVAPANLRITPSAVMTAMKEAKWVDIGRIGSRQYQTKKHVLAAPDLAYTMSKSQLRELAEVNGLRQTSSALLRAVK